MRLSDKIVYLRKAKGMSQEELAAGLGVSRQAANFLFGYYSKMYMISTILLLMVVMIYIFKINPKYMNRQLTKAKTRE